MALESFLLHFRNLRAFLCPSLQNNCSDDILASDFLEESEVFDVVDKTNFSREKVRLDKMLAHLSYTSEHYIETQAYDWPVPRMLVEVLEQLEVFVRMLSPEIRAWFPSNDEISNNKLAASSFLERPTRAPSGSGGMS